jgi:hypothetical protein
MNWVTGADSTEENFVAAAYAPPIETQYYRFALISPGKRKTTLYAELFGDGNWGFGTMFGWVLR